MKNKSLLILNFLLLFSIISFGQVVRPPKNGYIPDKETAIKIAEAIWLPVFGNKIYSSKPFVAVLKNNSIWVVQGTLHTEKGGVPYLEIQKSNCKVLEMYHSK